MENKNGTALITGASSGIGAVYADRLACRGKNLILVARRLGRLEELSASLQRQYRCGVEIVEADLSEHDGISSVVAILETREEIDLLVNSAGLGASGGTVSVDPDAVRMLVNVNILALTLLSLAVAPRFMKRKEGAIINIGSLIAFKSSAAAAAYCGSKAYVLNFTRSMQAEFANTNVKIQLLVPGYVRTEFFDNSNSAFPDDIFMDANVLVDCAMQAFDAGEMVCVPALKDMAAWQDFDLARQPLADASMIGTPATRYGMAVS